MSYPKVFSAMAEHDRMTIKTLSIVSGIPERTLSMKLNGRTPIKLNEMRKLQSILFNTENGKPYTLDELFREEKPSTPS